MVVWTAAVQASRPHLSAIPVLLQGDVNRPKAYWVVLILMSELPELSERALEITAFVPLRPDEGSQSAVSMTASSKDYILSASLTNWEKPNTCTSATLAWARCRVALRPSPSAGKGDIRTEDMNEAMDARPRHRGASVAVNGATANWNLTDGLGNLLQSLRHLGCTPVAQQDRVVVDVLDLSYLSEGPPCCQFL